MCMQRPTVLDSTHRNFKKKGALWFPHLTDAIKQLQLPINVERLSPAEVQLFLLFGKLTYSRHEFMHRQVQSSWTFQSRQCA